jgi:cytoskeletal protein CcmA (bactofilin family)
MFNKKTEESPRQKNGSQAGFAINSIEKGTVIIGEVQAAGNFRVDGNVRGTIRCQAKLVIGPSGMVEGDVECQSAEIAGQFKGKIDITDTLHLSSSASFEGEANTGKISIESGAKYAGICNTHKSTSGIKEMKSAANGKSYAEAEAISA